MPISASERARAVSFAENWIVRNINVGPFSCHDAGVCDGPVHQFGIDAARAGLTDAQLERALGPIPRYVANAFAGASQAWSEHQAAERKAR